MLACLVTLPVLANEPFWEWFKENVSRIEEGRRAHPTLPDEIVSRLREIHPDLVFEVATYGDRPNEFIVSADGIRDVFPHVERVVASAPEIPGWRIIAFRPREEDWATSTLRYDGFELDPNDLWFRADMIHGEFALTVFADGLAGERRKSLIAAIFLMLDGALGEYDVVTGVRYLDFEELTDAARLSGLRPFTELRDAFDTMKRSNQ